jgi:hypothetical protein
LGIITAASSLFSTLAPASPRNVDAVRRALAGWGVTLVAIPNPDTLVPRYSRVSSTAWALGLFTLVLHRAPRFRGDTWVWTDVTTLGRGGHYAISAAAFAACTTPQIYLSPSRLAVPNCVLRSSSQT